MSTNSKMRCLALAVTCLPFVHAASRLDVDTYSKSTTTPKQYSLCEDIDLFVTGKKGGKLHDDFIRRTHTDGKSKERRYSTRCARDKIGQNHKLSNTHTTFEETKDCPVHVGKAPLKCSVAKGHNSEGG